MENPVKPDHIEGSVEFSHVHFGYNPDQIIINDFSAKVKPGQQVAIVGPTGAGKTTMVKLLMRFYDVSSGAILVDGMISGITTEPICEMHWHGIAGHMAL